MNVMGLAGKRWSVWLVSNELAWLLVGAPFLVFPHLAPAATAFILLMRPLLWILRWRVRGRLTAPSPLDWPILGLLLGLLASYLVSGDRSLSLSKASGLLLGVALYYALVNRSNAWGLRWWLPWLGAGVALLGLVGTDWVAFKLPLLSPLYRHLPRLVRDVPRTMQGGFHPNEVGGAMAMCIPLALAALLGPRPEQRRGKALGWIERAGASRLLLGLAALLMGAVLLLTQSRTAVLALAVALWLMLAWRWPGLLAIGPLALAGGIAVVMIAGADRVMSIPLSMPGAQTWQARPEIWANAMRVIRDYPLTGIGLNTFAPLSREHYTYLIAPHTWDFVHAHNIWLQIGVDLGLLGLISFAALILGVLASSWRMRRQDMVDESIWWSAGLEGVLGAYLAFGLIDAITLGAKPSILIWAAAGLLVSRHGWSASAELQLRRRTATGKAVAVGLALVVAGVVIFAPLRSIAWANLGRVALNQGQAERAVSLLERAVDADRSNTAAQYSLGEAYLAAGREADALLTWRSGRIEAKALSNRGEILRRQGELDEAARWQGWALTLDAALSDAWYGLGLVRQSQGRARDALDAFRKALTRGSFALREPGAPDRIDEASVERALGVLLVRQGQLDNAIGVFRDMLVQAPGDVVTRFDLAQTLSLAEDYFSAEGELLRAVAALEDERASLPPLRYRELRLELSVALTTNANRRGDLAGAEKWARVARDIEPRHAFPYADLAGRYISEGEYDQAIAVCQAFLGIQADASGAFHYLLGLAHAGKGDQVAAIEAHRAAIAQRSDVAAFHYRLAEALAAGGDAEQAEAARSRAQALSPDVPLQLTGHYRLLTD